MCWLCADVPGDSERDFTERRQEFLKSWRAWYCILPLRCYLAMSLTGSPCVRGLNLHWHSPSELHQGSSRFLYLLQQEIWPLAFITSVCSLNTNLSLYLHSVSCGFRSVSFTVPTSWTAGPLEQSCFSYLCCTLCQAHFGQQTRAPAHSSIEQSLLLHNFMQCGSGICVLIHPRLQIAWKLGSVRLAKGQIF